MDLAERVKAICLRPKETWGVVKGEQTTVKELFTSYAGILAVIPPVATLIGFSIVGVRVPLIGTWRQPLLNGLVHAVVYYVLSLVGIYVTAYIADRLAPKFDSKRDLTSATKAVVFSMTPVWIVSILYIIPGLSILVMVAGLYSLYLLYMGLPAMMDTPAEKRAGYVVVVIIASIVVMFVISLIVRMFLGGHSGMMAPRF
jgi:Yip1 domain